MSEEREMYAKWAVLELMGHVKLAGFVTEVQVAGFGMLHVAIPNGEEGGFWEQHIPPASLYRMTTVAEEIARMVAKESPGMPVQEYDVRKEIRGQIAEQERESIEQRVRRDVAIEQGNATSEERRKLLSEVVSPARVLALAVADDPSERPLVGDAKTLIAAIDAYCEESHQRLRQPSSYPPPVAIHSDDDDGYEDDDEQDYR